MLFLQPRMFCPAPFTWLTTPGPLDLFTLNETSSDIYTFPDFPHSYLVALNLSHSILYFLFVVLATITCTIT